MITSTLIRETTDIGSFDWDSKSFFDIPFCFSETVEYGVYICQQ